MNLRLPRLYAILDRDCFATESDPAGAIVRFLRELLAGGVTLIQYRNKNGSAREMLSHAREIQRVAIQTTASGQTPPKLIMNDRADLCLAAGFQGVHVGQEDLSPEGARLVVGVDRLVGVSTHNPDQVREADSWPVDYIAVGPVFATQTKANPDPVVGLEGVRHARQLTRKPLVAIGGITRANCRSVLEAGADTVAVVADLLREPRAAAEDFLQRLQP